MTKGKIYKITWQDIQHDSAWNDKNDFKKNYKPSVNLWEYVGRDDVFEVFTSGGDPTQHFDLVHIPRGCIIKIEHVALISIK